MVLKYNIEIKDDFILNDINKINNQIFKLLPTREENGDWVTPLNHLIIQIKGINNLIGEQVDLFPLLYEMEGMKTLTEPKDFLDFRSSIFTCLNLLTKVKECLG